MDGSKQWKEYVVLHTISLVSAFLCSTFKRRNDIRAVVLFLCPLLLGTLVHYHHLFSLSERDNSIVSLYAAGCLIVRSEMYPRSNGLLSRTWLSWPCFCHWEDAFCAEAHVSLKLLRLYLLFVVVLNLVLEDVSCLHWEPEGYCLHVSPNAVGHKSMMVLCLSPIAWVDACLLPSVWIHDLDVSTTWTMGFREELLLMSWDSSYDPMIVSDITFTSHSCTSSLDLISQKTLSIFDLTSAWTQILVLC